MAPPDGLVDDFTDDRAPGTVIGSVGGHGAVRLGIDAEGVIGIDHGALRIQPLVDPGWGRAGVAYGPFTRAPGLAFAVSLLDGHNTSQAENLPEDFTERLSRWLHGTASQPTPAVAVDRALAWARHPRKRLMVRRLGGWMGAAPRVRTVPALDENLAVGFFPESSPADPVNTKAGNGLLMHALGPQNGELWAHVGGGAAPVVSGVQNLPLLLVVALRARGAAYYAASVPGAAGPGPFPSLRPLAIDSFGDGERLYAGVHQSVLGQIGFRVDTRVYRAQVAQLPSFASWYGGAQGADLLEGEGPLVGSPAARGGLWQGETGAFARSPAGARPVGTGVDMLRLDEPAGLLHALVEVRDPPRGEVGLVFRANDGQRWWALLLDGARARLCLREGNRDTDVAEGPAVLRPRTLHALTIRDDGHTITALLDGRALFPAHRDERMTAGAGVGLVARAAAGGLVIRALEAHPRLCPLPAPLAFAGPWQDEGRATLAADDFREPAGPLHGRRTPVGNRCWTRTLGAGTVRIETPGQARVQARAQSPNPGRTLHTILWPRRDLADLSLQITPPGSGRNQGERSRAGLVFWQDPDNYVTVSTYLDDLYGGASISSFFHLDGFEELYDAVWTNVGDRVRWGRPYRLRVVFDGNRYRASVDGEPVLYRALTDVYPGLRPLRVRRVGIAVNWEWGDDTGSTLRDFVARG